MGKLNCSHNFLCHAEAFKGLHKLCIEYLEDIKNFFVFVLVIVVLYMNILRCIIIIQVINNCLKIDKGQ